ncbi:hypothetical protein AB3S75_003150 [Citrus x aurantiifolia]
MAASQQASSINAQRESTLDHKLFRALRHGCTDKVREFARQNGNRILGRSQNGDTALHIAARFGHKILVMEILKYQPDLDEEGNTPLHNAVRKCDGKMAFTMIKKDPEPIRYINKAEQGRNNLTLLHSAIIKSQFVKGDSFAIISSILVPCHQKAPLRFSKKNPSCCRIRILSSPPKYSLCCISSNI